MSTQDADYTLEVESPFLDQEIVNVEADQERESRAAAIAEESPFRGTFEDRPRSLEPDVYEGAKAPESEGIQEQEHEDEEDSEGEHQQEIELDFLAENLEDGSREELDTLTGEEEETEDQWETLQEDQLSSPRSRPAPNTVDAEAAEPLFTGRVRAPEAPLLDAATLKLSSRWNQARYPTPSGITLAELCARLEQYLDRSALDDLVRRANLGATSPYGSDVATLVTLLAHQFQRKTCRTPTVGDVAEPCTVDGRVGEDTLDALGFVYHAGKRLNAADRANRVAAATLARLPAGAFDGVEPGLTAKTWWSYMVSPPWLGLPIKHGIHLVLLKKLRRAQRGLMRLPAYAYASLSPAELGRTLGLEEEHKGARPGNTDWSMHLFGLGIDISYTRNPWVSNPKSDTTKLAAITLRAARLVGPSKVGNQGITARFLHDLAIAHRDTAKIYKILAEWSRWLAEYLALAGNAKRLEGLLPIANATYPDGDWFKRGESLAKAAERWARDIRTDFDAFAKAVSRSGSHYHVRHGFMDLPRDLVIALRDEACLGWGAVDFGPRSSGDIMHFDCRVEGIGRTIARTSGKPFVPESGHPCLPTGGSPRPAHAEFEEEGGRRRSPPTPVCSGPSATTGHWLKPLIVSDTTIPKYKDAAGSLQATGCSIYVPDAAWRQKAIDLLVFFHGDPGPCLACFDPDPTKPKKFGLDAQIQASTRKIALAVPQLYWKGDDLSQIKGKWTAANFNKFVQDVLDEIGRQSSVKPTLGKLIIAGHSRAYNILTPLALEFHQGASATTTSHLAQLSEVWALDSTYAQRHVRALDAWAATYRNGRFVAVLYKKGTRVGHWNNYYKGSSFGFGPPPNLRMCAVEEGGDRTHCVIPTKYVGNLLATTKSSPDWCKP